MKIIKVILITLFCFFTVSAEPIDFKEVVSSKNVDFIKFPYQIAFDGERLSEIYKKFIIDEAVVSINHEMVKRTMKANQIDFSKLHKDTILQLYISVDLLDYNKFTVYQHQLNKTEQISQNSMNRIKEKLEQNTFRSSVFYMASYGKFSQANPSYADVSFLQNSPVSLGLSSAYYPKDSSYNISGSLYYSYLTTAEIDNYTSDEVKVDPEIGGNIYFSYRLQSPAISLYAGFDFEKFNTFNLENLQKNDLVTFDTNEVLYLTVGASRSIEVLGHRIFTKLSYSQSLSSQRSISLANAENTQSFTGSKILLYLFKNVGNNFFAHSLIKYHWMSGPSDITTLRVGLGFGYIL
ncbi:hypothetical protein M902_1889 [Bacteriovorax sp. BAL6_X]|uniref:hypothetical protein n=1 Tax=Bacteriovorax sp. BAL6_X TaxID=1201290 RepID=UPI000386CAE7|nr:hypothetical protein [Bacteriovorax sp. BAL6_X]EPZ51750.1 hypothetical protein M902_1889 [Bacteriovorax sp. BAL6_X]